MGTKDPRSCYMQRLLFAHGMWLYYILFSSTSAKDVLQLVPYIDMVYGNHTVSTYENSKDSSSVFKAMEIRKNTRDARLRWPRPVSPALVSQATLPSNVPSVHRGFPPFPNVHCFSWKILSHQSPYNYSHWLSVILPWHYWSHFWLKVFKGYFIQCRHSEGSSQAKPRKWSTASSGVGRPNRQSWWALCVDSTACGQHCTGQDWVQAEFLSWGL